tara:strand:+ start:1002 stop:1394 length:393 start_codon:yes stop_codon:yes gene_type:complete
VLSTPRRLQSKAETQQLNNSTKKDHSEWRVSVAELWKLASVPTAGEVRSRLLAECKSADCARYLPLVMEFVEQQKLEAARAEAERRSFRAIGKEDFERGLSDDGAYAIEVLAETIAKSDHAWAWFSILGL